MRNKLVFVVCMFMMLLTACGEEGAVAESSPEATESSVAMESEAPDGTAGMAQGAQGNKATVGQVTEVYGNEIVMLVGEMETAVGNMGGAGATGGETRPEGAVGEGGGEMSIPEGMGTGERVDMGDVDVEAMREQFAGAGGGDMGDVDMEAMREQFGGSGAGGGVMSGGASMLETEDISESIELTEEELSFYIPVGVPVTQMGTEISFTQITEGMYISVSMDAEGAVTAVSVLG